MRVLSRGLILALLVLAMAPASLARNEYVRDEIRINLRAGPGDNFRIVRVVVSGNRVERLGERGGWIRVRTGDGEEGWLPDGYLTTSAPASVALPRAQEKLVQAQSQIQELEQQLVGQREERAEAEALRARNAELEKTNEARVARWRTMAVGAAIALGGLLLGALWPRGGAARSRRIKL